MSALGCGRRIAYDPEAVRAWAAGRTYPSQAAELAAAQQQPAE
jgi:hypothetical protein